jgi:transcriptional regulator with XRE-family HTH domain
MTIELANRLIEFRKKHNLSQEQLADKLHVSRQTISKWERSEASPDTDNIIELAKLYNVPIDDLLNCDKDVNKVVDDSKTNQSESYSKENNEYHSKDEDNLNNNEKETQNSAKPNGEVHINFDGIHINTKSDDGSEVHIGKDGVHIKSEDGEEVHVSGDKIKNNDFEFPFAKYKKKMSHRHLVYSIITDGLSSFCFIAATIAYVCLGCLTKDGWAVYWPLFIFACVPPTIVSALEKRRFCNVGVPLIITGLYLILGMKFGWWHPYWIMFFGIPAYYILFGPIDKAIHHSWMWKNDGNGSYSINKDNDDDDVIDADVGE